MLNPPLTNPTKAEAKLIKRLEIPEVFIIAPAKINKGIAINGKFIDPSNITMAASIKKLVPLAETMAMIVVTARAIAIGTLIANNIKRTRNITKTTILVLLLYNNCFRVSFFARHYIFVIFS